LEIAEMATYPSVFDANGANVAMAWLAISHSSHVKRAHRVKLAKTSDIWSDEIAGRTKPAVELADLPRSMFNAITAWFMLMFGWLVPAALMWRRCNTGRGLLNRQQKARFQKSAFSPLG
jgi:hypothetical protein